MQRDFLFVANWKMQLTHCQSVAFVRDNYDGFAQLAQNKSIVVCPSFDALTDIKSQCDYICTVKGGQGAFRDLAELIIKCRIN